MTLVLTECGDIKEKNSYNPFTDIRRTKNTINAEETNVFKTDGSFTYYCGNPVNDSDLCEIYTYNEGTNEITLDCLEETDKQ